MSQIHQVPQFHRHGLAVKGLHAICIKHGADHKHLTFPWCLPLLFFTVCTTNILAAVLELVFEFFLIRTSLQINFPYPRGLIFQDIFQCKYRF